MTIEVTTLIQLIVIMISITLILEKWEPPLPKGQQGLFCLVIGSLFGYFLAGFNLDGISTGLLSASIAFWRGDLFKIFNEVKEETNNTFGGKK